MNVLKIEDTKYVAEDNCNTYEVVVKDGDKKWINLYVVSKHPPTTDQIELHILSCVTVAEYDNDLVADLFKNEEDKEDVRLYNREEKEYGKYLSKFFTKKTIKKLKEKHCW